jgi:hypothetical protein
MKKIIAFPCTLIIILTLLKGDIYATTYYSIIASGAGYRDFIVDSPTYKNTFISPYFEFGSIIRRGPLIGFNGMVVLNPKNTSEITLFHIGGQGKVFIIPKLIYIGGGPGLSIEGENVKKKEQSSDEQAVTIENPKTFFNINLHIGITLNIVSRYSLIGDAFLSQSVGSPYPYSANFMIGILSFW